MAVIMKTWLYYKIYAKEVNGWYQNLLREIVQPLISENEKAIESFFFFKYHFQYGIHEGIESTCEQKFKKGDLVSFIRLRILAEEKDISELETKLLSFVKASPTVLETEKCVYDELADIGNRFGRERVEVVRKYLEMTCRVALSLLVETRDEDYFKNKISGLIHLPSNILEYRIGLRCPQCGKEFPFQP